MASDAAGPARRLGICHGRCGLANVAEQPGDALVKDCLGRGDYRLRTIVDVAKQTAGYGLIPHGLWRSGRLCGFARRLVWHIRPADCLFALPPAAGIYAGPPCLAADVRNKLRPA